MPPDGPIGFKLEAAPAHPLLMAITLARPWANAHAQWMRELPHLQVALALLRDGFHPDSPGGTVALDGDGCAGARLSADAVLWHGVRDAFRTMAELQFAAGARTVMPIHGAGASFGDFATARAAIDAFALAPIATTVVSAHVMGGCPLGSDPARAAVDPTGRYHHLANLARARRVAVSDVDRRESAALDLRDRRAPRDGARRDARRPGAGKPERLARRPVPIRVFALTQGG